ncbi:hypothetical protein E2562_026941 [Oryza meyeriana var. granulata]|uniref:Uncharacterized protein n=1 Tax=Oryza meyeriana var. granulata TaxID=110450 RepID=A0A6G1BP31_9ORYZ|nr:hypothetical protein E2562_026941 [Oryza meyeriana var. granulata]
MCFIECGGFVAHRKQQVNVGHELSLGQPGIHRGSEEIIQCPESQWCAVVMIIIESWISAWRRRELHWSHQHGGGRSPSFQLDWLPVAHNNRCVLDVERLRISRAGGLPLLPLVPRLRLVEHRIA